MRAVGPEHGFGLYVHWPYCSRICPYCDFNVYAARDRDPEPLIKAIQADLEAHRRLLPDHPALDSVFLGGGTPSLLPAGEMAALLETAQSTFGLAPDVEITLEANPNDILANDPATWASAGINRLSIGVQSLDDEALSFLGRDHASADARAAIETAQAHFDNHSVDLIYARPGQSLSAWETELRQVMALGAPHLSLYELTIAERTAFGHRAARGELVPMPDDDQADLYELTQAVCEAHDLPAYEVSNHARGPAYQSRHNSIYWASGDWIGIGPGAHGRLTLQGQRLATEARRRPADYIQAPQAIRTELSKTDTAREFLAMALRPVSGLDLNRFEKLFGRRVDAAVLADLRDNGLGRAEQDSLILSRSGRLIADYIAGLLAP
ncbi:MAG: radical SAM family heme chaperone HemW [Pseudomonadota bacterium]